ncbi:glucoside xylosyltransferase 1-like [Apostichopus japonicus]|uniref:glucoside xylosyltransferase 1-like n=1 Tax=Stichopus japonicus TaxID=307972 RepID=UPI003AB79D26
MYPELALLLPFVFLGKMKTKTRLICVGVTFITAAVLLGFHIGRISVQREMKPYEWRELSRPSDLSDGRRRQSSNRSAKKAEVEPDYLQVIEELDIKAKILQEANEVLAKRGMGEGQLQEREVLNNGNQKVEEGRNFPKPITLKPRHKAQDNHQQDMPVKFSAREAQPLQKTIPNQPDNKSHHHVNSKPADSPPANQGGPQHVNQDEATNQREEIAKAHPPALSAANQQKVEAAKANVNRQNVHYAFEPIEILSEPDPLEEVGVEPVVDVFGKELRSHRECIHLSVVVCGDRTEETLIMLKSAAVLTKTCLVFHIFAEEELQEGIRDLLNSWPESFKGRVTEYVYPITFPSGENKDEWKKVFKLCATQRLFLPDLLPKVDSLLYIDTDILFIRPLERIWQFFPKFNSTQLAGLAPEHEVPNIGWYNRFARHPYYGKTGLNSGVMLMNLTRMRDFRWTNRIIPFYRQYRYKITWGDQDLINVIFYFHPDKVFEYPCEWNYRPDHCMYGNNCRRIETEGIGVIHGNRGVYHNEKQLPFRSIYEAFRDFQLGAAISTGLVQPLKEKWTHSNLMNMYCTKALRKPILSTLARYT